MDIIKKDKNNHISHILVNDHIPNPAFINEFQTNYFTVKLNSIEIVEEALNGYRVDQGGAFLLLHMNIRNNTNEILDLYREDFALFYNKEEPFNPEENFGVPYQFPDQMALKPLESVKGCYLFIIDKNAKKIGFLHHEYYDEEHYKEYHLHYKLT